MDLVDAPDGMPIASETLVIKPENQGNITRSNGSRNIRFHIPDYLGYWLPSQSNFTFNIKMEGRGNPIPSRDAGLHSLFNTIRSHDGTGSSLLEEVSQYNTYVAQSYNYTKTEATENNRAEFEGVQASDSLDGNLYWALAGGINWSGGEITQSLVPRNVQFVSPLKTKLYDTDQYVPVQALGGIRLELQLENYLRALEYTTGSLAIGPENALPIYPLANIVAGSSQAAVGAQPEKQIFVYAGFVGATVGTNYAANQIYSFKNAAGVDAGYVEVLAVAAGDPTSCRIFALGMAGSTASVPQPVEGEVIELTAPGAGGPAKTLQVNSGVLCIGDGKTGNDYQNIAVPLWCSSPAELATLAVDAPFGGAGSIVSPLTLAQDFGAGTARDPHRRVTQRSSVAYNPTGCYPNTIMPFSIGDRFHYSKVDGTDAVEVGVIVGLNEYVPVVAGTQFPQVLLRPTRPIQGGLGNEIATPAVTANAPVFSTNYMYSHLLGGMKVYTDNASRLNGWSPEFVSSAIWSSVFEAAGSQVDFVLSDMQYQAKIVVMPESSSNADMNASRSDKGLQIDLETIETRMTNQPAIQGPTSNLISIPNITRALGVLSCPLNQNEQRGLEYASLRGQPDNLSSYQFELGQTGLVPTRPVPVEKASLGNPLCQTQEVNEKMKCLESFGLQVSNLNRVGLNFSVGRQFARSNMYFDLMRAGDLILRCQYDEAQTSPKLFVHFINHIRSIIVNREGIEIMN